MRLTSI